MKEHAYRHRTVILAVACALLLLLPASPMAAPTLDTVKGLLQSGKTEQARRELDAYLEQYPASPQALFMKGRLLDVSGDAQAAIRVYQDLSQRHPELPEPYNNLAALYVDEGEYDLAEQALKTALHTRRGYAVAYANLESLYLMRASRAYLDALEPEQRQQGDAEAEEKLSLQTLDDLRSLPAGRDAARPAAATAAATSPADVVAAVRSWARAWSRQDVPAYLDYYADDFRPADGSSRADWAQLRQVRVESPSYIKVSIGRPQVRLLGPQHASIIFLQHYESNTFADSVFKHLLLERRHGHWQILFEDVVR